MQSEHKQWYRKAFRCLLISVSRASVANVLGVLMAAHFEIDDSFIAEQNQHPRLARRRLRSSRQEAAAPAMSISKTSSRKQKAFALPCRRGASAPAGPALRVFRERASRATFTRSWRTVERFSSSCARLPTVSLHIPWDKPDDATKLRDFAAAARLALRCDELKHVSGSAGARALVQVRQPDPSG